MHASSFAFRDPETICACPSSDFPDALLQLTLCCAHLFWSGSDAEVVNIEEVINARIEALCEVINF